MALTSEQLCNFEQRIGELRCQREERFTAAVEAIQEAQELTMQIEEKEARLREMQGC